MSDINPLAIAIVGCGCKVPGADNLEEFWRLLERGENHVIEIPKDRWNHEAYYDADRYAVGKTYAKQAGLLKDPLAFDNKLFNIPNVEADQMDPQQRYVLECVYRAMEDGGITREQLRGKNVAVYVGAMNSDYRGQFTTNSRMLGSHTITGVSNTLIAARVSFAFDFRGPAVTLDTACSSALVAVHLGIQALKAGDCDMAICGGTNSILTPDVFIHLAKAGMASAGGQCFTFSDKVDGYTRGEGCAMVILKRLSDVTEGDKVWATIGTVCNQDGGTVKPISAPSESQQLELLKQFYTKFKIDPDSIQYIEAHGTGTKKGDFAEVNALGTFFKESKSKITRHIGSVKTNIGHLESAAGTAGLIKVLLMMQHGKIVPSLFFDNPNPNIDFQDMNFIVPTNIVEWMNEKKGACVSSFGFGGTNCHAVVQAHEKSAVSQTNECQLSSVSPCIVCFSGKSRESLRGSIDDFASYPGIENFNIRDISYTSTQRREHHVFRKAFIVKDMTDMLKSLNNYLHGDQQELSEVKKPRVIFVFCGMGSDWIGMGRDMMKSCSVFRQTIQDIDKALSKFVKWSLEKRLNTEANQNDLRYWPIAIFACQIGLARLWKKFGVIPDNVIGHSLGEVAAAHICGILSLEDAVKVINARTTVLAENARPGKMIVLGNISWEEAQYTVEEFSKEANISAKLSPVCCAVSGTTEAIEGIKDKVSNHNPNAVVTELPVSVGYHSHCVDPCLETLDQMLGKISASTPVISMVSTVTGKHLVDLGKFYWLRNLRAPVEFQNAVLKTYDKNRGNIYIEIGPKPFMLSHVKDIFPEKGVKVIPSMTTGNCDFESFLISVRTVYELGCNVIQDGQEVTPVPRYCFQPRRTLDMSEDSYMTMMGIDRSKHGHPYVHKELSTDGSKNYKLILSEQAFPSVYDHFVSSELIVPGALYADVGFAVSKQEHQMTAPQYFVSVTFKEPCPMKNKESLVLDINIKEAVPTHLAEQKYTNYVITIMRGTKRIAKLHLHALAAKQHEKAINIYEIKSMCQEEIDGTVIYQKLRKLGFRFGPNYKLLTHARKCKEECLTDLVVTDVVCEEMIQTTIHPSILDAMLQTRVILAEDDDNEGNVLPLSFGKLTVFKPMEAKMYIHTALKSSGRNSSSFNMTLTNVKGEVIAELEDAIYTSIIDRSDEPENWIKNLMKSVWVPTVLKYKTIIKPATSASAAAVAMNYVSYEETKMNIDCVIKKLREITGDRSQGVDFIVLYCNIAISDSQDGDCVQQETLQLCKWLERIFKQELRVRIYLFTKWGIAIDNKASCGQNINPIMSSIWGFTRSALLEKVSDIVILDLHLNEDMYATEFSPNFAISVADHIYRDSSLQTFRQWVITEEDLFVWDVSPVRFESARLPDYREIFADKSRNMMPIYKEAMPSSGVFNVYDTTCNRDLQQSSSVSIEVSQTAIPSDHLLQRFIPQSSVHPQKTNVPKGFAIVSLESTGKVKGEENGEVICCYPSVTATTITVPIEVVLEKSLFSNYSSGNLSTLVMLLSIREMCPTQSVTILTSSQTQGYAELLELMFCAESKRQEVTLLDTNDIHEKESLNSLKPNMISLVRIDATKASHLVQGWCNAQKLIAVDPLVDDDAKTMINALLPNVRVVELTGTYVFQHNNIIKIVPKVKKILQESSQRSDISKFLKGPASCEQNITPFHLADLLRTTSIETGGLKVHATAEEMFHREGIYIVVSGLTGLGWIFVNYLAQRGAGYIAIINRRAPEDNHTKSIEDVCNLYACSIQTFQADVTHRGQLENVIASIKQDFGQRTVRGVFFAPAVLKDQMFQNIEWDEFYRVVSPKIKGAWDMHQLTKKENLDFFVCQSSITSVFGNLGQTNYTTGNAFLDGLAHYRRHRGLPAQSINWGALNVGLLEGKDKVIETLESRGFLLLSKDAIQALITPILLFNWVQTMPCKLNWEIWKKNRLTATSSSLPLEMAANYDLDRRLQNAENLSEDEKIQLYEEYVIFLVSQILGVEDGIIKPESSLRDMGMDSLIAMTVHEEINKTMNCKLPQILLVSGDPSPKIIAKKIIEELQETSVHESKIDNDVSM